MSISMASQKSQRKKLQDSLFKQERQTQKMMNTAQVKSRKLQNGLQQMAKKQQQQRQRGGAAPSQQKRAKQMLQNAAFQQQHMRQLSRAQDHLQQARRSLQAK